jgi:hypothetical protein
MGSLGMLDKLLEFEVALEDFYKWLSETFKYDRDVSETFSRLSVQERAHANLIRNERRVATIHGSGSLSLAADPEDVDRLLGLIDAFRGRGNDPDLSMAIEVARTLEGTAALKLHRLTVDAGDPPRTPFLEQLVANDLNHVEMLGELRERILDAVS